MNTKQVLMAAVALVAASQMSAPVALSAAVTENDAPKIVVPYGDLNLSTPNGAATLLRRIDAAARRVCPDAYSRDLRITALARECRRTATANAVEQVHNQRLSAAHAMQKTL
jgi:UrcA family protein